MSDPDEIEECPLNGIECGCPDCVTFTPAGASRPSPEPTTAVDCWPYELSFMDLWAEGLDDESCQEGCVLHGSAEVLCDIHKALMSQLIKDSARSVGVILALDE